MTEILALLDEAINHPAFLILSKTDRGMIIECRNRLERRIKVLL